MFDVLSYEEFEERFPDNEACYHYLEKQKWPDGFRCPRCGERRFYRIRKGRVLQCRACHRQESVTSGTLFEKTKVPLRKWFLTIWFVSQDKGGISSLRLAKHLGVSQRTAWLMLHKLRRVMGQANATVRVQGTVELDDAFFGGKAPGKRGRGAARKTKVLVCVEVQDDKAGRVVLKAVPAVGRTAVEQLVRQHLAAGTHIHTDAYPSYHHLKTKYQHTVHQALPREAVRELPWVHKVISLAKRFLLGTYHGVTGRYLQAYLHEFAFRFNQRFSERATFFSLLKHCAYAQPIRISALCY